MVATPETRNVDPMRDAALRQTLGQVTKSLIFEPDDESSLVGSR